VTVPRRERISVAHAQLVVQPAPEEVERFAPARIGELITPIASTADDRANGRRRYEVVARRHDHGHQGRGRRAR